MLEMRMRFLAIKRGGVAKERSQRCKVELSMFMKSDELFGSDTGVTNCFWQVPPTLLVVPLGFVWGYVYSGFFLFSVCR